MKERTLDELNSIYQKALKRDKKNWEKVTEFVENKVKNLIEPTNDKYVIYFYENNVMFSYTIYTYDDVKYKFGWSKNKVTPTRESNLDILLTDIAFELGEEFKSLLKLCSRRLLDTAKEKFWQCLKLRIKENRNKNNISEISRNIITVQVENNKYLIKIENYSYELIGEEFLFKI